MNWPLITVVTPSFNQGEFLERTINSVLDQKYLNLQYIIIDGGSTDNSVEVIKKYDKHLFYWHSRPDRGQPEAINNGFRIGTGEVLTWINSDDVLCSGALEAVAKAVTTFSHKDVFYGNHYKIDAADNVMSKIYHAPWSTWLGWRTMPYIAQPGTFFRRSLWLKTGIDEELQCAFDYDLWYRFMKHGGQFLHLSCFTAGFRIHQDSKGCSDGWRLRYSQEMKIVASRYLNDISKIEKYVARSILSLAQLLLFNYQRRLISELLSIKPENLCCQAKMDFRR